MVYLVKKTLVRIEKGWFLIFLFCSLFVYCAALEKKISVSFSNATIKEVCDELSVVSGINVVCDVQYPDTFSQEFKELELGDILTYICEKANCIIKEEKANLVKVYEAPRVKMNFKQTPFTTAITEVAKHAGVNIILDEEVVKATKTITASGESIPFEEALKIITASAGFYLVQEKFKIYRITTFARLAEQLEVKSFKLQYLRPQTYVKATIKTDYAQTTPPTPKEGEIFPFIKLVESIMTKKEDGQTLVGSLTYDEKTNTLVVRDTKFVLSKIESLINDLDREPGEILIDVYFITTRNEDLFRIGINYATATPIGDNQGWTFTTVPNPIPADVSITDPAKAPTETSQQPRRTVIPFGFGHTSVRFDTYIGRTDSFVTATLRLFRKDSKSKVIQQPTILALDNHEATIFVGDSIRWAESTVSVAGTSGTPVVTLQESSKSPVQVGFQLLVIPHIIPKTNKIQLTVIPQSSSLIGTSTELPGFDKFASGSQTIFLPRTRSSTLITNLIVESGQTAVLGGLITHIMTKSLTKVPLFGDIPLIGELFKYRENSEEKTHLLIYITPKLVKSTEITTAELNKKLQMQREKLKREYEQLKNKNGSPTQEMEEFEQRHRKELEQEYERLRNK
ncbi:MAG: hypothetical protein ACK4NF_05410 [Planctomycetota bacterium]